MANILNSYPAASDITITLASLATDANLLVGRQSTAIDNSTNLYTDYLVSGKITAGTSPTTAKSIEVWAVGSWDGTNWPDAFAAADAGRTFTSADIKSSVVRLLGAMATDATSNRAYHFGPTSVAGAFGGTLPPKFAIFVAHSTAVALNATAGNHQIRLQPVFQTVG